MFKNGKDKIPSEFAAYLCVPALLHLHGREDFETLRHLI